MVRVKVDVGEGLADGVIDSGVVVFEAIRVMVGAESLIVTVGRENSCD